MQDSKFSIVCLILGKKDKKEHNVHKINFAMGFYTKKQKVILYLK